LYDTISKCIKDGAKPFVKWAGGKGQLIDKLNDLYPDELICGKIETKETPKHEKSKSNPTHL
jgi:hypothetical protein